VIKIRNILFTILIVILFASNLGFSAELPRVAVIGFDSTSPGYLWSIDSELSKAATDLMINALVNTNRFRVFERTKLEAILQEQDFQVTSGRVDPSTAVKIGKMIGVDSIVTGSVTSIMFSKSGGITLGPLNLKKSTATVTVTVRAINVTTGEIIFSEIKKGITSKSGVSLRIPVPVVGGLGLSSESVVDIFSAIEDVCQQVAVEFAAKLDSNLIISSSTSLPLEGRVAKVDSTSSGEITQVYINLGANSGIQVGEEIKIFQEGEVILDPNTQEVLDTELILVAQARIIEVKEKLSIALVTTKYSNASIMLNDFVQVIR
jgi:curli biogenesis system outer membrane secretion channel CsgG